MLGALGTDEAWLFTGVFFVGAFLAGLGRCAAGAAHVGGLLLHLEHRKRVRRGGGRRHGGPFWGAFVAASTRNRGDQGAVHLACGPLVLLLSCFTLVAELSS